VACYQNSQLRYLVAEVHNTPWNERFTYVHDIDSSDGEIDDQGFHVAKFDKQFHVSPFMPMNLGYAWSLGRPGSQLALNVANYEPSGFLVFDADLLLHRREINHRARAKMIVEGIEHDLCDGSDGGCAIIIKL
jgi:hypothetical protein